MTRRRLITLGIVLALVVALAAGWWVSTRIARPSVAVVKAVTQTLDVAVTAAGTLTPAASASVTAPTQGTLGTVVVSDGQQVEAGQLLATMDAAPLDAAVAQDQAQLAGARAMPTSTTRLRQARDTAIHAAQLALDIAKANRDRADIKAPAAGIVQFASLSLAPGLPPLYTTASGSLVTAGLTLFTVVTPDSLRFDAAVDEADIAGVQVGQQATVTLDAFPGRPFTGTVEAIHPAATATSTGGVAFTTTIRLDAGDARLLAGMTGDTTIGTSSVPDALVVPVQAVSVGGGDRTVWRIADGVAHRVTVEIGPSTDTLTQVVAGLSAGDEVAMTNLTALTEGAGVDVQR